MEYSIFSHHNIFLQLIGIWNIPKELHHNYFWYMEYSRNIPKKCNHNENIGNSGIWNIPWNIPWYIPKKNHNPRGRKV